MDVLPEGPRAIDLVARREVTEDRTVTDKCARGLVRRSAFTDALGPPMQ